VDFGYDEIPQTLDLKGWTIIKQSSVFLNRSPIPQIVGGTNYYLIPVGNLYIDKLLKNAPIIWWAFCASAFYEQRFPGIGRVEGQSGVSERITRTV